MWETISTGKSSPRKELVINIDTSEGASLRVGDMKILLNVPNVTWYKPPELEKSFNIKHEHQKQLGADYLRERLNSGLLTVSSYMLFRLHFSKGSSSLKKN